MFKNIKKKIKKEGTATIHHIPGSFENYSDVVGMPKKVPKIKKIWYKIKNKL